MSHRVNVRRVFIAVRVLADTEFSPSLQELVQQKENEWREAQELQIKSAQSALKEKERQLNNEKLRFRKLKEDFEYNLKLLEERDQEL